MSNSIETVLPDFKIKWAKKGDVTIIKNLIYELAAYEKLTHQVTMNKENLREFLFGKRKYAEVLLGYVNDQPVGFALFFHNFSTFLGKPGIYLEDLYIQEKFRGRGYGKALLSYIGKIAVERNCGRIEWAVLDWNKPAIDFYLSLGSKILNEWLINRVTGDSLLQLAQSFKQYEKK